MLFQSLYEFLNKIENHKFYCAVLFFAQYYATYSVVSLIPHLPLNDTSNNCNLYHFPLFKPASSSPSEIRSGFELPREIMIRDCLA